MATTSNKANRNPALDFTKGVLVLIMVLYHWINYFWGPQDNRYLRFLTPSFIFITGFLISNVYLSKYAVSDSQLPKRLLQRGAKILGVFLFLNILRLLLVQGPFFQEALSDMFSAESLVDVFIVGSGVGGGQSKAVAFFVLIPIAYLLILSAVLAMACRIYRYAFHVMCVLCLLCVVLLSTKGLQSPNLELVAIGLLGVIGGYAPIERINSFVRHPYFLVVAYLAYLAAITAWNIIYPLQIFGVYLSLMIIYLAGLLGDRLGKVNPIAIALGKYSLLGYILQIAILQLLHPALRPLGSRALILGSSFLLAFALTILGVLAVDRVRTKSPALDKLYKVVFA